MRYLSLCSKTKVKRKERKDKRKRVATLKEKKVVR